MFSAEKNPYKVFLLICINLTSDNVGFYNNWNLNTM